MEETRNKLTPKTLFITICLVELIAFFVYAYMSGEEAWRWFTFKSGLDNIGTDYFRHLSFSTAGDQLYEIAGNQGFFPPLSYMFYYFFFRISSRLMAAPKWLLFDNTGTYDYVFIVYLLVSVWCIYLAVDHFMRGQSAKSVFICIITSAAFLGSGLIVGNTVIVVFPLILLALDWKESTSKWKRELALIFIAVSAAFKIYPAIFGFLYVKERRWGETLRLIVYGFFFFFAPFVFFGGITGAKVMVNHIFTAMYYIELGRIQYIRGVAVHIMTLITGNVDSRLVNRAALYSPMIFLILMFVLTMFSRNRIREIFFFTCAMIFFPTNAYRYSLALLAVPLLFWLRDEGVRSTPGNWITALLYAGLFGIPMVFGLFSGFGGVLEYDTLSYVEFWLYGCAYALVLYECGVEIQDQFRRIVSRQAGTDGQTDSVV